MKQYVGMNYIDGFLPSRADFGLFNPIDKEPIGYFPQTNELEIDEAFVVANKSFSSWNSIGNKKRAEYFLKLANSLEAKMSILADAVCLETGKPLNEVNNELSELLETILVFGETNKIDDVKDIKGIFSVISSNLSVFGFYFCCFYLIEGNVVIFKSNELSPMSSQITAEIFQDAGFPPGTFNLLHGNDDVGFKIANDKRTAHAVFASIINTKGDF
jgi:acyl-CoA reductase-like NAD-dependent aldehyde dehydrogenase